jgi:hypothetical protein
MQSTLNHLLHIRAGMIKYLKSLFINGGSLELIALPLSAKQRGESLFPPPAILLFEPLTAPNANP